MCFESACAPTRRCTAPRSTCAGSALESMQHIHAAHAPAALHHFPQRMRRQRAPENVLHERTHLQHSRAPVCARRRSVVAREAISAEQQRGSGTLVAVPASVLITADVAAEQLAPRLHRLGYRSLVQQLPYAAKQVLAYFVAFERSRGAPLPRALLRTMHEHHA